MARRRLSPHFAAHEFDEHTGRHWPPDLRQELVHLCDRFLEPLRSVYGPVTIVSGYRSRKYNVGVGGAPQSFHIYDVNRLGVAADVVAERGTPREWAEALARCGPCGLGVYATHVHIDSRRTNARW